MQLPKVAEARLLVLCAHQNYELDTTSIENTLAMCGNSRYFEQLCAFHKVVCPVRCALEKVSVDSAGDFLSAVLPVLRLRSQTAYTLDVRVSELADLVARSLANANIPFAFIRGKSLARRYYPDPALRISTDVDIIVHIGDRVRGIAALLHSGLRPKYQGIEMEARAEYKGQTVFRHYALRLLLDVNWLLTGNSGIGKIEEDLDLVWSRAKRVSGVEWQLSTEDVLFGLIRHVGHGHGFEHGLVQCCMDVAAIMRKEGDRIDWDYIGRVARDCECMRVMRFFAHFFDTHYRNETMATLSDKIPHGGQGIGFRERELFARHIIAPMICFGPSRQRITRFTLALLCHAGKIWALDTLCRLGKILVELLWPNRHALVIMTPYSKSKSLLVRRLQYYIVPFLAVLPAICVGVIARLLAIPAASVTPASRESFHRRHP